MASRRPIELYKIDSKKVDEAKLQEIINLLYQSEEAYDKWLNSIFHQFDAKKDILSLCIEQAYPLSSYQWVGNCVWESLQTCLYGILMLNRLKDGFDRLESDKKTTLINLSFGFIMLNLRSFAAIFRKISPQE